MIEDGKIDDVFKLVCDFYVKFCEIIVFDFVCGLGNFLYVVLEMMKWLEGEVILFMYDLGDMWFLIIVDLY